MSVPYTKQLAYIESTGTQYIDTGFKPNQDTRVICSFEQITTRSIAAPFGCESPRYSAYIISSKFRFDYNSTMTSTQIQVENNVQHEIDFNKNNVYLDGALNTTFTYGNFTAPNLLLFRTTYGSSNFYGRIYWCKVYDNDVLVRDFIPVRVNEVGYFYDKVSGELFNNAGSGYFVFGDDVINHDGFLPFRRRLLYAKPKELPNYLCFTALEDGTFTLTIGSNVAPSKLNYIEYSLDGKNWVKTNNVASATVTITTPTIIAGEKIYWRGQGIGMSTNISVNQYSAFSSTGKFKVSGCIASLLTKKNFEKYNPITTEYVFASLFFQSKIVDANELILSEIATQGNIQGIYMSLFKGCTDLIYASELDLSVVTNLGPSTFREMFNGCTALVNAPKLPFKVLSESCYMNMFRDCTSLLVAPDLPATTLPKNCYYEMFKGCISLKTVDVFNGIYFGEFSCYSMFQWCRSLATVSDINISSLGNTSARTMFSGCSTLMHCPIKSVPNIVTNTCFYLLFQSCTALEDIFDMPAEILQTYCYGHILSGNSKVNRIKMLATDISASNCVVGMKDNGASTGLFIKNINATWNNSDVIHSGWTVIYYDSSEDKYYLDQSKVTECDDHGNPI